MSGFCIYGGTDEGGVGGEGGGVELFEGVEGCGGCVKGVNATQREVRKKKLAIHEGFGTSCTPICSHMGSNHA